MPVEKIVEYRILVPCRYALDLIVKIGELGFARLPLRAPELPPPKMPSEVAEKLRKSDEVVRELSRIVAMYAVPEPEKPIHLSFSGFDDMANYVISEGTEILSRIAQYTSAIEQIESELSALRRLHDVIVRLKVIPRPEFRHVFIDIVQIERGEAPEFTKALALHKAEFTIVDGEMPIVIVLYPEWIRDHVYTVYKIFNKKPIEIKPELTSREVVETKIRELEEKKAKLSSELRELLLKIRDRIYSIIETGNAISATLRVFAESALSEGEEVKARLQELVKSIEDAKLRVEELRTLRTVLEHLMERKIVKLEFVGMRYRAFAIVGGINTEYVRGLTSVVEDVKGVKFLVVFNPPPDLDVNKIIRTGRIYEISTEYLKDVKAGLSLVGRELSEAESRLRDLERDYKHFAKIFDENSIHGVEKVKEAAPDATTLTVQVREKDARLFEDALSRILAKLAVHAEIRKTSKYMYIRDLPRERTPTLETYPKFIDAFKKITFYYGVPRFGEVSPTPIAFFLFPFFYGWMFPDVGHGLLIFLLGLLLAKWVYKGKIQVLRAIFDGKRFVEWGYIFMQCGIWSIVFSFIESGDIFGVSLKMLGGTSIYHLMKPATTQPLMSGVLATLAYSILAGFIILWLSVLFRVINSIRFGERFETIAFGIPMLIGFIAVNGFFISYGMIPLYQLTLQIFGLEPRPENILVLADHVLGGKPLPHAPEHELTSLDYVLAYFTLAITLPSLYALWTDPSSALARVDLWLFLGVAMTIWYAAAGLYGYRKHVHTHEPFSTHAVEGAEIWFVWTLANTISFMRLGIIAIVHAVVTALVTWGTYYALASPLAITVSLVAGGAIGFIIFRVFGKPFAAGFLAVCLLGTAAAWVPGLSHVAWFVTALLGNVCVVIFEGLVAFIQSLRLHFYEMFTKYFRAGGTLFVPFRIGSPLVRITIV